MNADNMNISKVETFLNSVLDNKVSSNTIFGEMLTKESIDPSWSDMVVVEIPNGLDDMDAYGEGVVLVWLYAKPLSSGRKNVALMSRMEKTLNDIIRDNRDKTYHLSRRGTYTDYNTSINWHCNIVELILKVF
jgi:hypothetical protein